MSHPRWSIATALFCGLVVAATGQEPGHDTPPAKPAAETKNGTPPRPLHAPQPELPPLGAWQHVRTGNEAIVAARAAQQPVPALRDRPAGAGRYVCAVFVCADADVDIAALLGLARRDVLLFSAPGPFVQAEAIALLERAVSEERLSLVLVIGHTGCRTLAPRSDSPARRDALTDRVEVVAGEAARTRTTLSQCLARMQCEQLVGASDLLQQHVDDDTLRVLPAELDLRSGALRWLHHRSDELPMRPIR